MRLRITYQKTGGIIFTSALDLQKIWERSFRRANLLVMYSEGFHPQPKIQLAVPLPVGFHGSSELIDVWFKDILLKDEIFESLQKVLPAGLVINSIEEIPENQKALNSMADSAIYLVTIIDSSINYSSLQESLSQILNKKVIERERNKKHYDLRPLIGNLELRLTNDHLPQIQMHLLARAGATGRPDEVIRELGIDPAACKFERASVHFHE